MLLLSSLIAMVGCGGGGSSDSGESGNNPLSPAKDKFATKAEIQANIPGVWERYSIEKSTINGLTAVETSYRFVTFPNGDFRQFAHGTINNKPILCYSHGKYGISDGKILCNNRKISIECQSLGITLITLTECQRSPHIVRRNSPNRIIPYPPIQ